MVLWYVFCYMWVDSVISIIVINKVLHILYFSNRHQTSESWLTTMADSDDDYDRRKGRDKFRRERNDYERREERRRDSWEDR